MKDEQNGGGIFRNIRRAFGFKTPTRSPAKTKKYQFKAQKRGLLNTFELSPNKKSRKALKGMKLTRKSDSRSKTPSRSASRSKSLSKSRSRSKTNSPMRKNSKTLKNRNSLTVLGSEETTNKYGFPIDKQTLSNGSTILVRSTDYRDASVLSFDAKKNEAVLKLVVDSGDVIEKKVTNKNLIQDLQDLMGPHVKHYSKLREEKYPRIIPTQLTKQSLAELMKKYPDAF